MDTRVLLGLGLFILLLFAAGFYFFGFKVPFGKQGDVVIKGATFRVDVADTMLTRMQGLSGRDPLAPDQGLLFLFGSSTSQTFWMKDMKFAIDIVWIQGDRITGVAKNAPPEPGKSLIFLTLYHSPSPVDKVLELPAGTADRLGFGEGDQVTFQNILGI